MLNEPRYIIDRLFYRLEEAATVGLKIVHPAIDPTGLFELRVGLGLYE